MGCLGIPATAANGNQWICVLVTPCGIRHADITAAVKDPFTVASVGERLRGPGGGAPLMWLGKMADYVAGQRMRCRQGEVDVST